MLEFRDLELSDRDLFRKYLGDYPFNTYEYSFTTLYLWRRFSRIEHAIYKGALILKKTLKKCGSCFMQPVGYADENLRDIVDTLYEIKQGDGVDCLLRDVEEGFLEKLKRIYGARLLWSEDERNFDYIYDARELATLSGRKWHDKRNHYNQFVKSYNYSLKDIAEPGVLDDCIEFARAWQANRGECSEQLVAELAGTADVLKNAEYLGLAGMALYVGDEIAGFTIGEQVNPRMAIIHIEKADPRFKGVYAFINKTFVERYFSSVTYINREEDLGIEGLRRAKASYNPIKLEKKYVVNLAREVKYESTAQGR